MYGPYGLSGMLARKTEGRSAHPSSLCIEVKNEITKTHEKRSVSAWEGKCKAHTIWLLLDPRRVSVNEEPSILSSSLRGATSESLYSSCCLANSKVLGFRRIGSSSLYSRKYEESRGTDNNAKRKSLCRRWHHLFCYLSRDTRGFLIGPNVYFL